MDDGEDRGLRPTAVGAARHLPEATGMPEIGVAGFC